VKKSELLKALRQEIRRHDFNYCVHEPPSIAQGGRGVVVPGCPTCLKRINTIPSHGCVIYSYVSSGRESI